MTITPFSGLICPLDQTSLTRQGNRWCCGAGHSFDIASQGYVNLLPVQHKRSLDPGDSKQMVAARRDFLNAAFYQPISSAVNDAVLSDLDSTATSVCLDAGCGEGYYLRQLAAARLSTDSSATLEVIGLDISKWAVLSAAKQYPNASWVVGTNAHLPVPSASIDRLLCIFGFPVYAEFARVLKPDGQLVQVDAGPDHLRELREIIYPTLKPQKSAAPTPAGFVELSSTPVTYLQEFTTAQQISDLLAMTPHLHRASAEGRATAAALTKLTVTIDVHLTQFRNKGN